MTNNLVGNTYRIGAQIGEGYCSTVKIGTNIKNNNANEVAIKIISKSTLLEHEKDNIRMEMQTLKRFDHPNIIKLMETFEDGENLYLVMELMPQDLLQFILQNGKLREDDSRKVFLQVVDAVKYCHSNGIAHRDLKLENVVINEQLEIRLIDFGMCGMLTGKKLNCYCGSRSYAPPEIIKQRPYDGAATDVWSLGVILYALLVGGFPFADDSQVLEGKVRFPRGTVSKPAADLVVRMLQRSTRNRITVDDLIAHPWLTSDQ